MSVVHRYGALALLVLAAGCAGGGALSADVRGRADLACGQAAVAVEQIAWPGDDELSLPRLAPSIGLAAGIQRDLVNRLASLSAETDDGAALDELVTAGRPLVVALERLEDASAAGDDVGFDAALAEVTARTEEAAAVSERLDLRACYTPLGVGTSG